MASVVIACVENADNWQGKKVKKSIQVISIYTKAAKAVDHDVSDSAARVLKAIEATILKDNSMSNLKSKMKELKLLIKEK